MIELDIQPLQFQNFLGNTLFPLARQSLPVAISGQGMGRNTGELNTYLIKRITNPLGKDDKRDTPQGRARKVAVTGLMPLRFNQPSRLIKPQG